MSSPSAFPCPSTDAGGEYHSGWDGMTLRDYFAAAALKGFLAAYNNRSDPEPEWAAKCCFKYADAMLKARGQ